MGKVFSLAEFRKQRSVAKKADKADSSGVYFCNRCAGEQFRLSPLGAVSCSRCGALMRNISVTKPAPSGQRRPPR